MDDAPSPLPVPPSADPRAALDDAFDGTARIIAGIAPEHLSRATPCTDFDVRGLLSHLVMVAQRVAAAGRDEPVTTWPLEGPQAADDAWPAVWRSATDEARAAWADPTILDRPTPVPWGTFPGRAVAGVYASECIVHAWDLARATGQQPVFGDETVAVAFAALQRQMPAEGRQELLDAIVAQTPPGRPADPPFTLAVPVADEASPLDRLVAWSGRSPDWTPA